MASKKNTIINTIRNNNNNNSRKSKRGKYKYINMKLIRENFASATPYDAPSLELLGQPLPPWETEAAQREEETKRRQKRLREEREHQESLRPDVVIIDRGLKISGIIFVNELEPTIAPNSEIIQPYSASYKPNLPLNSNWIHAEYKRSHYWINIENEIVKDAITRTNPEQKLRDIIKVVRTLSTGGRRTKRNKRSARRKTC